MSVKVLNFNYLPIVMIDLDLISGPDPKQIKDRGTPLIEYNQLKRKIERKGFIKEAAIYVHTKKVFKSPFKYFILDGGHRWTAAKELGMKEIPCRVFGPEELKKWKGLT